MANKPNNPSLWSRAKSLARQKFDVYPSAYANGWAAKYYKSKGGTWRKAKYGMQMESGGKMPTPVAKARFVAANNGNIQEARQDASKYGYKFKKGGSLYQSYMASGGKVGGFPDRYKKMGFSGVDKPKRTTSGNKSHAVVTKVNGNYKLIRFGQKGVSGSPDGSARNKAFKARHAKNIAKGKSSAAYWANKIKWILFIPLMLCQTL